MASPFIWGDNGQKMTPQQVERERLAAALMARDAQATTPVASPFAGLNRALQGYLSGRDQRRSDAAEAAGMAGADAAIAGLTGSMATGGPIYAGSMGGQPVADPRFPIGQDSVAPPNEITPGGYAMGQVQQPAYLASLIGTESGGNWAAKNNEMGAGGKAGHFGRVQFGQARLQDAMNAGAIPQGVTPEQFMASPELQMAAEQWHFADLESQLAPYVGAVVNGQPLDMGALVAMGHLGGAEGAKKYVESGGAYNPSDSFGTSLSDYAQAHGGKGGNVTMSASGGPSGGTDLASLLALSADPWVTQKYGGVVDALMGQAIEQRDPLYQAQLAAATAGPGPSEYEARAQAAAQFGLDPMALQSFVLTGQLPEAGGEGFTLGVGQQRFDAAGNLIAAGTPEPGFAMVPPEEVAALGLPPGAYQRGADGKISQIGGGDVTVNNTIDGGGKFEEAFAKGDAETIAAVSDAGIAAQRNLGRIDQLEALLSQSPSGIGGVAAQVAGEWGLAIDGTDQVQAARALINSLVPEQRQPGSGPMSDADLELFKQSLPRIVNQPGGNQIIVDTMRAIAEYDAMGAVIVQQLRAGEISRAEAFAALQSRPNPLANVKAEAATPAIPNPVTPGASPTSGGVPEGIDPADWELLTPEERALWAN